jgi:hypothetical protein
MKLSDNLGIRIDGHVQIVDDLGHTYVDKSNAIHPQNMARIFARALANESNYSVYRIAFGNGGTTTDAAFTVSYNPANDGQPPDTRTWDSRLYNETYSEIVNEGNVTINPLLGTDPGTAGPNVGTRPGGGSVPASDPSSTTHTSGPGVRSVEEGVISKVIITSVLNPDEPLGQGTIQDVDSTFESSFAFDEIGLYTSGAAALASAGIADVNVGNKTSEDDTGLVPGVLYDFKIKVDALTEEGEDDENIEFLTISFVTPPGATTITFGDLCEAINTGDPTWNPVWGGNSPLPGTTTVAITDNTADYPSITGAQTFGFLRFVSSTVGEGSSVLLDTGDVNDMFAVFGNPTNILLAPVNGQNAGVQNDPLNPTTERERLISHLVFSPVVKAAQRTLTVTYTLTISVARTLNSL